MALYFQVRMANLAAAYIHIGYSLWQTPVIPMSSAHEAKENDIVLGRVLLDATCIKGL